MTPPDGNGAAAGDAEVRRFSHGSRIPGWDRAVDLDKDPAAVPEPATTPVPDELRAQIEARMALYPDRRSAAIPALAAAQYPGWLERLLTHPVQGLDNYAEMIRLLTEEKSAIKVFVEVNSHP